MDASTPLGCYPDGHTLIAANAPPPRSVAGFSPPTRRITPRERYLLLKRPHLARKGA